MHRRYYSAPLIPVFASPGIAGRPHPEMGLALRGQSSPFSDPHREPELTRLELAILSETDPLTLVVDVIHRVPGLASWAAHLKERVKSEIVLSLAYATERGPPRPVST